MATTNPTNSSDEGSYKGGETPNPNSTDPFVNLLGSDRELLNSTTVWTPTQAPGKLKQMLGWRSLVDDEEMSFGLLMILNEQKAHISDTKKEYDDLIKIVFEGQLNSNGIRDGNALFHGYQKWIGQYSNRKMKTLCNGVIDFFANDINMCELGELRGLATKLKVERDTSAEAKADHLLHKKQSVQAARERKERVESQLGFRSTGKGITLSSEIAGESPENLDGLAALGKPTGSKTYTSGHSRSLLGEVEPSDDDENTPPSMNQTTHSTSVPSMTSHQKRSRANQEALDVNLANHAANGKKRRMVTVGKPVPRSIDSAAHMDEMAAYSRGMLQTVTKLISSLADSLSKTNPTATDTASPFSKNAKKRQSLYKMLSEEMNIKKMLVDGGDTNSSLFHDCVKRIKKINDDINTVANCLDDDFNRE